MQNDQQHAQEDEVPQGLLDAIDNGECVAFLGAGFTAAAGLPTWTALLEAASAHDDIGRDHRAHVAECIALGTASSLDEAAQLMQDVLGSTVFASVIAGLLDRPRISPAMEERLTCIRSIPFRAVLTLNFDGVVDGVLPDPEGYRSVLRPKGARWWDDRFWSDEGRGVPVLKLHGDIGEPASIVLTRRDYRRRLYGDPDYMAFLRSVLARYTVLYLGFSFVDAYLNELRSESLSLLGHGTDDDPVAYAVINDASEISRAHYRRHEGVHVLSYATDTDPGHGGFDRILGSIRARTDPVYRFGRMVAGKRILWVDRSPANNAPVYRFLRRAAGVVVSSDECRIDEALDAEAAIRTIAAAADSGEHFDLVISHWGHGLAVDSAGEKGSVARSLLSQIHTCDLRVPVLIFSTAIQATQRKKAALRLGAQGYFFTFEGLLRGIEGVLSDGVETG